MKAKATYKLPTALRKFNWKQVGDVVDYKLRRCSEASIVLQIPPIKLTENAFWVKVNEDRLASEDVIQTLAREFATKGFEILIQGSCFVLTLEFCLGGTSAPGDTDSLNSDIMKKKAAEPKVLDPNAARNLCKHRFPIISTRLSSRFCFLIEICCG